MKNHLYRLALLAGALTLGAAAGSAQTFQAHVPFDFQVPNAHMPAGRYTVHPLAMGSPILVLSNWKERKSVMVASTIPLGKLSSGDPRLVFRCVDDRCALSQVWGATPLGGVLIPESHKSPRDQERLSVIYLERTTAEKH